MTRLFPLGDVLSVTTGKLVSPRLMDGIYDILNFMTGESLYTHQIPRACRACARSLIGQYPNLADVDASTVTDPSTAKAWLAKQVARFGKQLAVEPMRPGAYMAMDPLDELATMVDPKRIIVVKGNGP